MFAAKIESKLSSARLPETRHVARPLSQKEKSRLAAGPSLLSLSTRSALPVALLIGLLALTVRILLLLSGLLAAALLLAGLLARVLVLLARILILVRHNGLPG
jgi:hypothetical protein